MDQQIIHIEGRTWPVRVYGRGRQLIIALHGFGEDGSMFAKWERPLGALFTIVAVDLPYHGNSNSWAPGAFRPKDVIELIAYLLDDYQASNYTLVGHSFGARTLLASWKELNALPNAIWLLAPDGLATRRLGLLNRLPLWFRKWISRNMENHHHLWTRLARKFHQLGWLDAFSVRYVRHHLSDAFSRQRLMGTWTALPNFPVDREQLLSAIIHDNMPFHLVIGRKDPLIDWGKIEDWLKKWPASNLHELNAGHDLITEEVAELIRSS